MTFLGNKKNVVQFVNALLDFPNSDSLSIMIMCPGKLEAYCAIHATNSSWEDTVENLARAYFLKRTDI